MFKHNNMTREEVSEQITPIAREIFMKPELVLSDKMNAASVDTWTSLSFMQFLTAVEEKFGFKYKMMELLKLKNMGAVIDSVVAKIV